MGEQMSERVAALAGADDNRVVFHRDPPVRKRAKTIHRMPQECMKIKEISQDDDVCPAKHSSLPNATGRSVMALACAEKFLYSTSELRECVQLSQCLASSEGTS